MKKIFLTFLLVSACTGGGLTGGEGMGPGGPVGGGAFPVDATNAAHGSGDGILGSQSSSTDIHVKFLREEALDFEGEMHPFDALVARPMVGGEQAFGQGRVRKVEGTTSGRPGLVAVQASTALSTTSLETIKGLSVSGIPATSELIQPTRWVRAIQCGNFPDEEIEKWIPPQDLGQPWAEDKLLWLVLNLPRPGYPALVECQHPTYRDFPIGMTGEVDLAAFSAMPQDLIFFSKVEAPDFATAGPLSLEGDRTLSAEQWLALAKRPRLRIVRLLAPGETLRVHAIPHVLTISP